MNCLDFRREALAQPLRLAETAQAHVNECPACRAFLERQRELDAELYDAMRVPVPDGLADRVLVAQGIRRRRSPWAWALAATLVLAAGITVLAPPTLSGRALAGEAIAHIGEEPESLKVATQHDAAMLPTELAAQGVRLAQTLGAVTYAQLCPLAGGTAHHLVIATAGGPVTLFLLPDDGKRRARAVVEADGMTAITFPAARGNIAIVASNRDHALAVERSLILS
jgi:uncharacterized protein DUF3379